MDDQQSRALHVRCERDDDGKLKGLLFDRATQTYRSGWWSLLEAEAKLLVGGWLYLHAAGCTQAEIGGRVLSFDLTQVTTRGNDKRVVFEFDYCAAARGAAWRGDLPPGRAAALGRFVTLTLPHETD